MGYVVSHSRGAWGRLHRDDAGCSHVKQSKSLREATTDEIANLNRCRQCFPKDPVKRMLLEEGAWYRAEQRCNEFARSLFPRLMQKGE